MPSRSSGRTSTALNGSGSPLLPEPSGIVVLGLDLSMTGTGAVVFDGHKLLCQRRYRTEPLDRKRPKEGQRHGQLAPDRFKGTDEERIAWLIRKIVKLVNRYNPDCACIEGHSFASKGRGVSILHEYHGVTKHYLHRMEVPFALKAPPSIKLWATGSGRADKSQMLAAAQELFPNIDNDDVADALHCARMHLAELLDNQNLS